MAKCPSDTDAVTNNNEKLVQGIVTQTLATVLGAMGNQGFVYPQMPAYASMQLMPVEIVHQILQPESVEEVKKRKCRKQMTSQRIWWDIQKRLWMTNSLFKKTQNIFVKSYSMG